MKVLKFNQFGQNLGTRMLGSVAREKLLPMLCDDEKVQSQHLPYGCSHTESQTP